jgi:hypothetical protein
VKCAVSNVTTVGMLTETVLAAVLVKTCENGGVLDPDKCFCNCSATDYIGDRCEGMCLCILSELLFICCNTFAANCGRLD